MSEILDTPKETKRKYRRPIFVVVALILIGIGVSFSTTFFVIPPIGAVPEGRTVWIVRQHNLNFIDSSDGFCLRVQDGVSLFCRGMVMAKVLNESKIILKLPYMEWMYLISTGGKEFSR